MHEENYEIAADQLAVIKKSVSENKNIIAVGTTSVRVLESSHEFWPEAVSIKGSTDIFIYPGYKFKVVDHLLTNFHAPESTLLALVYAFGGEELIRRAYQEAIDRKYRFLSYGDAMFII